jgi:hypothetical protein
MQIPPVVALEYILVSLHATHVTGDVIVVENPGGQSSHPSWPTFVVWPSGQEAHLPPEAYCPGGQREQFDEPTILAV